MTESVFRACMMFAFLLAFVMGSILGFLVSEKSEALSTSQVALAVSIFVVVVGATGILERRYVWWRHGGASIRKLERDGRKAGGNVQPISIGFGLGLVGGWFAASHGTAGPM
jgi:hypothetical protein